MITFSHSPLHLPLEYKLVIKTKKPIKVGIIAKDDSKDFAVYTKRWNTVKGLEEFLIKMPQSPRKVRFEIYNINSKSKSSEGIRVVSKKTLPLKTNLNVIGLQNPDVVSFVKLAQEFSLKAGYLSSGTYVSDNGKFVIKYLDDIIDNNGRHLSTPARINVINGIIEVSRSTFKRYTIPGRMGILLHEFSHVYQNRNASDEVEADLNAARIYLGLGYPRIELINVFSNVFYNADTKGNRNRIKQMSDYIMKFDNLK
ncbi:MAG: hypothetical protein HC892_01580 [Saprospiraceae bacterium]|nr:hypothetical protein [Saprospiraceae bacterium]